MVNSQKIQGRNTSMKCLEVFWSGKMHTVPEAMTDKMQTYPTPKNVKEMQASLGILKF